MPMAPSTSYEFAERGEAIDRATTPPVLVTVPRAMMVPPVVVPAATPLPPVIRIPSAPELVTAPMLALATAFRITPPVNPVLRTKAAVVILPEAPTP